MVNSEGVMLSGSFFLWNMHNAKNNHQNYSTNIMWLDGIKMQETWLKRRMINPLTVKSDQHPVSPYNTTPESNITVTRIKQMINN